MYVKLWLAGEMPDQVLQEGGKVFPGCKVHLLSSSLHYSQQNVSESARERSEKPQATEAISNCFVY
jgi:hypothetical protein